PVRDRLHERRPPAARHGAVLRRGHRARRRDGWIARGVSSLEFRLQPGAFDRRGRRLQLVYGAIALLLRQESRGARPEARTPTPEFARWEDGNENRRDAPQHPSPNPQCRIVLVGAVEDVLPGEHGGVPQRLVTAEDAHVDAVHPRRTKVPLVLLAVAPRFE